MPMRLPCEVRGSGWRPIARAVAVLLVALGAVDCDDDRYDCDARDPYCRCDPADPRCPYYDVGPDGRSVGGFCDTNADCVDFCEFDNHYERMCTLRCDDDGDCPIGSACIDDAGGICAVTCDSHAYCDPFGAPWVCDDRGRRGASGSVAVCRIP